MTRFLLLIAAILQVSHAFSPTSSFSLSSTTTGRFFPLPMAEGELDSLESIATDNKATSLEEKMKSWEASEEEIKAATLGGVVPGGGNAAERTDAFDVGLYIAFPIMVVSCLAFIFFPFLIGNIDITSVGPPPTS
eukprot:CAMPEP_0181111506 /NCGR_PEP_ID=MMETSP1071-20121207/19311_1 /TAXON_ID=35127 /ORGANISM="Thalassiosira sp., Strain NH16" /LENGTH=134 /DNA_ID=CAMNT_0023195403 /DNA_START=136 /DNA_END=540 /DNA_ORIENTATION=+